MAGTDYKQAADKLPAGTSISAACWSFTVALETGSCSESGSIHVVEGPAIPGVQKMGSPFRLKLNGTHFLEGAQVFIAGDTSPWTNVTRKSDALIVMKGGAGLKARFPQGQSVLIHVVNPDGGKASAPYTRP